MLIGYARISTEDQRLDLQVNELKRHGVDPANIYTDKGSGVSRKRVGLSECLRKLEAGDTLVIWKLDRLARSLLQLIELSEHLNKRDVGLKSLTECIDTNTPGGRLIFHVFGAVGQFERDLIQERTRAGMKAAKERGVHVGRKRIATAERIEMAKDLIRSGECISMAEVSKRLKIAESTLYRDIKGGVTGLLKQPNEIDDVDIPEI